MLENGPMVHLHNEFGGYGDSPFDIVPVVPAFVLPSVQHFALIDSHFGFGTRYCVLLQLCAAACVARKNNARETVAAARKDMQCLFGSFILARGAASSWIRRRGFGGYAAVAGAAGARPNAM